MRLSERFNFSRNLSRLSSKQLGLLFVGLATIIIVFEGSLTLLRARNIEVGVRSESGETTTTIEQVIVEPERPLLIDVMWDYRIGPRFPQTIVRAEARNLNGDVIASDEYIIDCGTAAVTCTGSATIEMLPDNDTQTWEIGQYSLKVERSMAGLNYLILDDYLFRAFR
jgi:hypothetical protein